MASSFPSLRLVRCCSERRGKGEGKPTVWTGRNRNRCVLEEIEMVKVHSRELIISTCLLQRFVLSTGSHHTGSAEDLPRVLVIAALLKVEWLRLPSGVADTYVLCPAVVVRHDDHQRRYSCCRDELSTVNMTRCRWQQHRVGLSTSTRKSLPAWWSRKVCWKARNCQAPTGASALFQQAHPKIDLVFSDTSHVCLHPSGLATLVMCTLIAQDMPVGCRYTRVH